MVRMSGPDRHGIAAAHHLKLEPPCQPPLLRYQENVTSQCGEDGVIHHALQVIGETDGWCVEFGAADGRYASNTHTLIAREDYSALLIESDAGLFDELRDAYRGDRSVTTLRRYVGFEGPDRLDAILEQTPIPENFDLLSIDIDGNDYHVWDALEEYRPKLVVIEFNPTIPNEVDFVQARDMSVAQGSSLTALARLGRSKGYRLIHATTVNGVFVDERYFDAFGIADDSPASLRADLSQVTWLFQTYDGRLQLAGSPRVRWHNVRLNPDRLQVVPRVLRDCPKNFGPRRDAVWRGWRAWRRFRDGSP
jgi:hypothetical protein